MNNKLIIYAGMFFVIFNSILYIDFKKEDIQSFALGDLNAQQVNVIRAIQEEYNTTYYNLELLPEQKEFLKNGMKEALPNEVAFCLYGIIENNTITVTKIYDGTIRATPISANYHCEMNGDYLFAVHSHPASYENWECFPSDKDLYSIADNNLKLNGIMCFDDNPKLFLTDINSELLEVTGL